MTYSESTARAIKWFAFLISTILLFAAATAAGEHAQPIPGYSEPLRVKISQLINDPDSYLDKTVTIVGAVGDVCPAMGCWADVFDNDGGSVRF